MTIHNPAEAKLSKKDIEQGWRFCFVEELKVARPMDALYKAKGEPSWTKSAGQGNPIESAAPSGDWAFTYITRTPRPKDCGPIVVPAISDDPLAVLAKMLGTS